MDRLIHTSRGWSVVEFHKSAGLMGFTVGLRTFDEEGWEESIKTWREKHDDREEGVSLAEFLEKELRITASEASTLAGEIRDEWPAGWLARGGPEQATELQWFTVRLLAVLSLVLLLALAGVGLAIWLLVT